MTVPFPYEEVLKSLDPAASRIVYFRADASVDDAGPLQVSWDGDKTWTDLTPATDKKGRPAYALTLIGPHLENPPPGHVLKLNSHNYGSVRLRDNPETFVLRFTVDVKITKG